MGGNSRAFSPLAFHFNLPAERLDNPIGVQHAKPGTFDRVYTDNQLIIYLQFDLHAVHERIGGHEPHYVLQLFPHIKIVPSFPDAISPGSDNSNRINSAQSSFICKNQYLFLAKERVVLL